MCGGPGRLLSGASLFLEKQQGRWVEVVPLGGRRLGLEKKENAKKATWHLWGLAPEPMEQCSEGSRKPLVFVKSVVVQ